MRHTGRIAAGTAAFVALIAGSSRAAPTAPTARTAPAAPAPATADQVIAKGQEHLNKPGHVIGEFRHDESSAGVGTTKHSHGTFEISRPGKFRFDYASRSGGKGPWLSYRSDGAHQWVVNYDRQ